MIYQSISLINKFKFYLLLIAVGVVFILINSDTLNSVQAGCWDCMISLTDTGCASEPYTLNDGSACGDGNYGDVWLGEFNSSSIKGTGVGTDSGQAGSDCSFKVPPAAYGDLDGLPGGNVNHHCGTNGDGVFGDCRAVQYADTACPSPSGLTQSCTQGTPPSISLDWSDVGGASGYDINISGSAVASIPNSPSGYYNTSGQASGSYGWNVASVNTLANSTQVRSSTITGSAFSCPAACPTSSSFATPSGLSPSTVLASSTTTVSLTWTNASGATAHNVRLRDNTTNPTGSVCGTDIYCWNAATSGALTPSVVAGHSYTWWVDAVDVVTGCTAPDPHTASANFSVANPGGVTCNAAASCCASPLNTTACTTANASTVCTVTGYTQCYQGACVNNNYDPLSDECNPNVTCTASPNPANANTSVAWTAYPSGGSSTYSSYSWTGAAAGLSTAVTATKSTGYAYQSTAYTTNVTVTDNAGNTSTASSCSLSINLPLPAAFTQNTPAPTCSVTSAQVVLSWGTSTGATSYQIWRKTGTGGTPSSIGAPTPATGTSFTDTTPSTSTQYCYLIKAINTSGTTDSDTGTYKCATTSSCTSAVTPPTIDLTMDSGQLSGLNGSITVDSGTTHSLAWTTSASCTAANNCVCNASNAWTGSKNISGSGASPYSTGSLTGPAQLVYVISCSNDGGGPYTDSVTVNVNAPAGAACTTPNTCITAAEATAGSCASRSGTCTSPAGTSCYFCPVSSFEPWIQTIGGDVHSNTLINTPGGP